MRRREIPEGYTSSFHSHIDPAIAEPPPSILQQKQAETLMGHCLKEFIKERLYGNLINYTRKSNDRHVKFTPLTSRTQDASISNPGVATSMPNIERRRLSQVRANTQKRIGHRYDSLIKDTRSRLQQQRGSFQSSVGDHESSLLLEQSRQSKNKSALTNQYTTFHEREASVEGETDRYKHSGFISAIQEDQFKTPTSNKSNQRLSPLLNSNNLQSKLEKIKLANKSPAPSRIQPNKFNIGTALWDLITKKSKKSELELDNSFAQLLSKNKSHSSTETNKVPEFNLFPTMAPERTSLPIQSLMPVDKNKYAQTKAIFSKELLNEHLSSLKHAVKILSSAFFQFFQLNGKISDEMKMEDYKQVMEIIAMASPRVWAVCAFRFWDTDSNSLICSSDIFRIFKDLDALKTEIKQTYPAFQTLNSYRIVLSLLKTVDSLRQIILQQRLEDGLKKSASRKDSSESNFEIKYLEESILRKKELKYSDLLLILGQNIKIATSKDTKRSVIETTREIRIKMSSCYRFSFLATDHNEKTRQDREHIQNLKESLRKQKMELVEMENQNELINKKLPGISYTTFVEKKLYLPMKELACLTFGVQLI